MPKTKNEMTVHDVDSAFQLKVEFFKKEKLRDPNNIWEGTLQHPRIHGQIFFHSVGQYVDRSNYLVGKLHEGSLSNRWKVEGKKLIVTQ